MAVSDVKLIPGPGWTDCWDLGSRLGTALWAGLQLQFFWISSSPPHIMHWMIRATFIEYYISFFQYNILYHSIIYLEFWRRKWYSLFSMYSNVICLTLTWYGISGVQGGRPSSQSSKNGSLPFLSGCRRMVCSRTGRPLDPDLSAPSNLPWQSKYKAFTGSCFAIRRYHYLLMR